MKFKNIDMNSILIYSLLVGNKFWKIRVIEARKSLRLKINNSHTRFENLVRKAKLFTNWNILSNFMNSFVRREISVMQYNRMKINLKERIKMEGYWIFNKSLCHKYRYEWYFYNQLFPFLLNVMNFTFKTFPERSLEYCMEKD